jgi:hypothetical protein
MLNVGIMELGLWYGITTEMNPRRGPSRASGFYSINGPMSCKNQNNNAISNCQNEVDEEGNNATYKALSKNMKTFPFSLFNFPPFPKGFHR